MQALIPAAASAAAIQTYALYPDSFDPFLPAEVGQAAIDTLRANGIKNRYGLHSDQGRALAFVLLTRAFKQHRYDHAALWIAALSHSTADMAALNHDPYCHWLIYAGAYKLQMPGISSPSILHVFDVHSLVVDTGPEGLQSWQKSIAPGLLKDDGSDPTTELIRIMMYGNEGADFCAQRAIPIVADALKGAQEHDPAARHKAQEMLAELGAWAVGRTVRDTCCAYRFAGQRASVELTPEELDKFATENARYMHDRKISDDQLFLPILKPLAAQQDVPVALVLEPDWRMNDAMLGYGDRIIIACACRSLGNAGRDYATLDVRDLLTQGAPDPKHVHTLVISASALRDYGWMHISDLNKRLKTYLEGGGHILWIGGEALPPDALAPIAQAATRMQTQTLPIQELMKDDDKLHATSLVLVGVDSAAWPFMRPPAIKTGWIQPVCPWKFVSPSAHLQPLLQLHVGEEDTTVGVLWTPDGDKTPAAAFFPIYSVAPKLFVKDGMLQHPTEPELDEPSKTILFHVLDVLTGQNLPGHPASAPMPH